MEEYAGKILFDLVQAEEGELYERFVELLRPLEYSSAQQVLAAPLEWLLWAEQTSTVQDKK